MRHRITPRPLAAAAVLVAGLLLAGCGNADDTSASNDTGSTSDSASPSASATTSPSTSPSASPSATATKDSKATKNIRVIIQDGNVYPDGARIKIKRGTAVTFRINAEVPGELHVHSTPEQHIEYGAGDTVKTIVFDRPGRIAVEDHALDKLLVQLEVQ